MEANTAELPGIFTGSAGDLVGFAVGVTERGALLPQTQAMAAGDMLVGLPASGLHSNGFSLVRSIVATAGLRYDKAAPFDPTRSLGEALLMPSRIYVKPVLALIRQGLLRGAASVAAGGLTQGGLGEIIPQKLTARFRADAWEIPTALRWLAALGKVKCRELASTFNCGLGMVLIVALENVERVLKLLRELHEEPVVVGDLSPRGEGDEAVEVEGAEGSWLMLPELGVSLPFPEVLSSLQEPFKRTLVLAGGEDLSPIGALYQAAKSPACAAEIVAVASAHVRSSALARCVSAGLKRVALGDGCYSDITSCANCIDDNAEDTSTTSTASGTDEQPGIEGKLTKEGIVAAIEFSSLLQRELDESHADLLVLLDDIDLSLLTCEFLKRWEGKTLIVHASLLPAFPGRRPIESALRAGVGFTGCTVAFALPAGGRKRVGLRHGPIILQESARVQADDNAESLRERVVSECERRALPRALELVAAGSVFLQRDGVSRYRLERKASHATLGL